VSGPIVRKYGFPNFEQIFGKRELEHGVDEDENENENANRAAQESEAEITAAGVPAPASQAGKPGTPPPNTSS
jgi:hypothetical protein